MEILRETVKVSVAELVDDYLFFNNFESFLTETLLPIFIEVANEAKYEVTTEVILEEMNDVNYYIIYFSLNK